MPRKRVYPEKISQVERNKLRRERVRKEGGRIVNLVLEKRIADDLDLIKKHTPTLAGLGDTLALATIITSYANGIRKKLHATNQ